jgi:phosphatidate cytidylyltransferase
VGLTAYTGHPFIAWGLMVVGAALCALLAGGVSERPGDAAYGVIYLAPAMFALIWLHGLPTGQPALTPHPDGRSWVLMSFFIAWAADSAAFALGSLLKGPKLWPRLSPNKTWAGFVGGIIGAIAVAVACVLVLDLELTWWGGAVVGLCGGVATMAGDLWESLLKRRFGVKDSGDLIPGHGGLLDRVDGLMFAVVVVAITRILHDYGVTHLWGLS